MCPVQSFDESVLNWAAGVGESEFDLVRLGPIGDGYTVNSGRLSNLILAG